MENRASRYPLPEKFKSAKGRVLASGSAFLTAALLACSSGDANTSPRADGTGLEPINTPGVSIKPPGTGGEQIIVSPTAEPNDEPPIRSSEHRSLDNAIVSFAKQVMKSKFVPSEQDIANGRVITGSEYPSYSRVATVGGTDFLFGSREVNGKSKGEYILKDRTRLSDGSLTGVINVFKEYFNVPESGKWVTISSRDDLTAYELMLNRTPDFQISLLAFVVPDARNSTPENPVKIIRVTACSIPAGTIEYERGTCMFGN